MKTRLISCSLFAVAASMVACVEPGLDDMDPADDDVGVLGDQSSATDELAPADNGAYSVTIPGTGEHPADVPDDGDVLTPEDVGPRDDATPSYFKCTFVPSVGAAAVQSKYLATGGSSGILGSATTSIKYLSDGAYQHFAGKNGQGASIYYSCATGAHYVMGSIRSRWSWLGWETGFLKYPITDEMVTPDGVGRYTHFQGGSIYWKPTLGAFEVHGLIRSLWASMGWELSSLGYAMSDELPTRTGSKNRYSEFENGALAWKYGASAAYNVPKNVFCSVPSADMKKFIDEQIDGFLDGTGGDVYRTGGSSFSITDYSIDWQGAHNRMYKVKVPIAGDVPILADPDIDLTVSLEVGVDKATRAVRYQIVAWSAHITVHNCVWSPFGSWCPVSTDDVSDKLHASLDGLLRKWTPITRDGKVVTIPSAFALLNLKTQKTGDLDCFAPLDL